MFKAKIVAAVGVAAITFAPLAHADDLIGNAGGIEQPLPSAPGDSIGTAGEDLPLSFLDMISGAEADDG